MAETSTCRDITTGMARSYPGFLECREIKHMRNQWIPGTLSKPGFEANVRADLCDLVTIMVYRIG